MSQFQSMFDVDTDAMRAASFDSVFDNSEEAAKNFDSIFGAEEDDRLMEAVIGFAEDGTDLPDGTELHNNEEDDLGDDGVTPKNFGDGIFDDETKNAPKKDTSDNTDVIDRSKGAEGTKDVTDVDCPKAGVQDGGQNKAVIDPEHIDDASAKETQSAEKDYDFHQESAWIDDILGEGADLNIEGTDKNVVDIEDGVQDNGNTDHLDDDQVEHLEDESRKETEKATNSYEESVEDLFGENANLGDPDPCTNTCNDLGMPNDKDGEGGLPDKKPEEGEIKNANAEYQDDLDEIANILSEDADEEELDDSDEDEANPDEDDDVEGATSEDIPDEDDDIDLDDDDLYDDSEDTEECCGSSTDDDHEPVKEDCNDQQEDGQQSDQVAKEEQEKEDDSNTVDEAFLFEDDQIEDELNGVVDDQDCRDGYETAVDHYEGEEAPAEDLDEAVSSILGEADTDDSEVDEAIDDDAIQAVEDNDASGEGDLNLDYDPSDDEIFDDVNKD